MIEEYLAELDRELRRARVCRRQRRRLLAEVGDHLRSDPEAVARFGDPRQLARRYSFEVGRTSLVPAVLLLGAILAYILPLYWIPENTLPPAPPEGLGALDMLLDAALATFASALLLALAAVCAASLRLRLMTLSALALVSSGACALAAAWQWPVRDDWTLALVASVTVVVIGGGLAALAWAAWPLRRRGSTLPT